MMFPTRPNLLFPVAFRSSLKFSRSTITLSEKNDNFVSSFLIRLPFFLSFAITALIFLSGVEGTVHVPCCHGSPFVSPLQLSSAQGSLLCPALLSAFHMQTPSPTCEVGTTLTPFEEWWQTWGDWPCLESHSWWRVKPTRMATKGNQGVGWKSPGEGAVAGLSHAGSAGQSSLAAGGRDMNSTRGKESQKVQRREEKEL